MSFMAVNLNRILLQVERNALYENRSTFEAYAFCCIVIQIRCNFYYWSIIYLMNQENTEGSLNGFRDIFSIECGLVYLNFKALRFFVF